MIVIFKYIYLIFISIENFKILFNFAEKHHYELENAADRNQTLNRKIIFDQTKLLSLHLFLYLIYELTYKESIYYFYLLDP